MDKKNGIPVLPQDTALGIIGNQLVTPDPLGSYTGVPEDPHDTPVQDADDL